MRYSRQAERDIRDIWLYVAASSPAKADRALDLIKSRCGALGDFPHMGPQREDIFSGARALVIDRWLAIYVLENDVARVMRILDGARDLRELSFQED